MEGGVIISRLYKDKKFGKIGIRGLGGNVLWGKVFRELCLDRRKDFWKYVVIWLRVSLLGLERL